MTIINVDASKSSADIAAVMVSILMIEYISGYEQTYQQVNVQAQTKSKQLINFQSISSLKNE